MATVETSAGVAAPEVRSLRGETWRRLRRNRMAIAGIAIIALVALAAIFADLIATQPTEGFFADQARESPSARHWFGTDQLGLDLFSRVVHGTRISLMVGFSVVASILLVGIVVGGAAGYFGGIADTLLSRLIDVFLGFPFLVGTIILVTALGGGKMAVIVAIAFFSWPGIARLFRGSVISIRGSEYVEAARALGAGHLRMFFRHVLPNSVTPTLVYAFALIPTTIIAEAALSFLGFGIQNPAEPSWGLMIARYRPLIQTEPHLVIFPGMALTMTAMGFILLGDGLRDALDPRLR
ncbi:MAG: ABC transporter permease [Acidobacteria bacterium]|nr:ABC transporter permease [Acidobacteriota bacterium]